MPPFSPTTKGFLPNSRNEFCPEKPCQPSVAGQATHGGPTRPVEPPDPPVAAVLAGPAGASKQSAVMQYHAPGTRRLVGTGMTSAVFAMFAAMVEFPHGGFPALPHDGLPSAGPPAS